VIFIHNISINIRGGQMGSITSGRRANTPSTDQCLRLNLSDLRREGDLQRHHMSRREKSWVTGGTTVARLTLMIDIDCLQPSPCLHISGWAFGHRIDQHLDIVAQSQFFGGERFYVLCPYTGKRCRSLIMPPTGRMFSSVKAWGGPYTSQRESPIDRCWRRIDRLEGRMERFTKYTKLKTRDAYHRSWVREQMFWEDEVQELCSALYCLR